MFVEEKSKGEVKELDATSNLLLKAAALIEEYGHCKNQTQDQAGRLCLWGGILMATYGSPFRVGRPLCEGPAWKALERCHVALPGELSPICWNNAPERTGAEVIAKLRAAAFSS